MSKTYYLGVFPTPGGDKHHLFTIEGQGGNYHQLHGSRDPDGLLRP